MIEELFLKNNIKNKEEEKKSEKRRCKMRDFVCILRFVNMVATFAVNRHLFVVADTAD